MSSGHYKEYDPEPGLEGDKGPEPERVGLLSGSQHALPLTCTDHDASRSLTVNNGVSAPRYALKHLLVSFTGGIAACLAVQLSLFGIQCYSFNKQMAQSGSKGEERVDVYASPWVGSTTVHNYPPPSPTNDFPELFPT